MQCGCKIKDGGMVYEKIEFCPLHAAAEQMLKELKSMQKDWKAYDRTEVYWKRIGALIAKAEQSVKSKV